MIKKNKGFKFRLKPTKEQEVYFNKAFANVQLDFKNAIKKFNNEYDKKSYKKSAIRKVTTLGRELTFKDLKGMPTFKSRKKNQNSYTKNNQKGTVEIRENKFVKIPKLKTLVRFVNHRQIPKEHVIKSATISKDCRGKYYISFITEYYEKVRATTSFEKVIGLDYAQADFYVSSDNEKANYPKYYKKLSAKLIKEQRKLSSKKLFSNNWNRQKRKVSKLQLKMHNQRLDWLPKKLPLQMLCVKW